MTAPARITQADIERTLKSIRAAGFEKARIVLHLNAGKIEVLLGDSALANSHD